MKQEIPKTADTPASVSNLRSYFTKEVNEQIAEMSIDRMTAILKDLPTSEFWIAILKYTQARMPMLDAQLRTTDPYKNPYAVVFAQGCMAGLCDIESFVIDQISAKPVEDQIEGGAVNSNVIGNG